MLLRKSSMATIIAGGLLVVAGAALGFRARSEASSADPHRSSQMINDITNLPKPIQQYFESSNRGDPAAVVACFASNASLNDWGRKFEGHAGIASWDSTDNTGVHSHLEAVSASSVHDAYVVNVRVSGGGFNGIGQMSFVLEGDKISKLDIR
jgi:hypothetical protein